MGTFMAGYIDTCHGLLLNYLQTAKVVGEKFGPEEDEVRSVYWGIIWSVRRLVCIPDVGSPQLDPGLALSLLSTDG
jgi:hypothetical protein